MKNKLRDRADNRKNSELIESDYDDYSGKGRIKKVNSDCRPKRETKNWTKAWSEHVEDYDERDEFYVNAKMIR